MAKNETAEQKKARLNKALRSNLQRRKAAVKHLKNRDDADEAANIKPREATLMAKPLSPKTEE